MRMESDKTRNSYSDSESVVYSKVQTLYCRNKGRDDLRRNVRITLEVQSCSTALNEKSLYFKLSDDNDPFFFYALRVTEDDFKILKSEQGLLVDFHNFPSQLVILLQQCTGGKENEKFVLILDEDSIDPASRGLQIVEKNEFKHLCHLVLHVGPGTDEEIKKYMSKQIQALKEQQGKAERNLSNLESSLTRLQTDFKLKCHELEEIQTRWREEKNNLQVDHMNELREERERFSHTQHQWQRDHQRQMQEVERRHSETVAELEKQVAELKSMSQSNFEKLCNANSKNKELKEELVKRQHDISLLQNELMSARKQSAELDKDYHEKEMKSNQLQMQNSLLKEEIKEKTETLLKLQEQVVQLSSIKKDYERRHEEREDILRKRNIAVETLSKDLAKANEILSRLQKQQIELNTKLKLRTKISVEQEKVIERKEGEITELKNEIKKLEEQCKKNDESEKILRETLAVTSEKLEAKEKALQTNSNVISWLNKKLNDLQKKSIQPVANPQYVTSTPADTRGWIRTPPEVRGPPVGLQRTISDSRMHQGDCPRPPPSAHGFISQPPSSSASADTRPRTAPISGVVEPRGINDNPASKNLSAGSKSSHARPQFPRPFVPPASAYFSKPQKN